MHVIVDYARDDILYTVIFINLGRHSEIFISAS